MTDETTTEQLAEIEGQGEDTPATGYTPPEGWRVVQVGEPLKGGDEYHAGLGRYIRPIEPQPEPEPEPEPVQVREGRWKTRHGAVKNIRPCEPLRGAYFVWPWTDGLMTFQDNGRHQGSQESPNDLVEYLGPIEEQPEPQPQPQPEQQAATIEELRSEVSYVQNLLGTERRRVTQLEELVGSLRTINEAQEKAFTAANNANDDLQHRLNVLAAEWAEQAETSRRLQIELDAAQQVPADSPEMRQLRADLAEVIQERDTYRDGYDRVLSDLETIRETTKAAAVEAITEWTEPIRACGSQRLAWMVMANLPHIMRTLTGLTPED